MSQPVANDGYYRLTGTAAGTTIILPRSGNWNTYTVGTATTGTVTFYDSATIAGTAAGNQLNGYTGAVVNHDLRIYLKNGLVALLGAGTIDALLGIG